MQHISMKKFILFVLLFWVTMFCQAQNLDSIRTIINKIDFKVPVLSPLPSEVKNVKTPVISLNGIWKFNPESKDMNLAKNIEVPGEWVMQGFKVEKGKAATYWKSFNVPADWQGNRIRLRFDGVSSYGAFKVNGKTVGSHEGSFVAFEYDVTDVVKPGENLLEAEVQSETVSDKLACTSQYAAHTVVGILRKVTLYTLPQAHIADFSWYVKFDTQYRDATINIHYKVHSNESSSAGSSLRFALQDLQGNPVKLEKSNFEFPGSKGMDGLNCQLNVKSPKKWDSEHPNLYTLTTTLVSAGNVLQVNKQKIGFRQIELRGNQFYINNYPVKLRGVNRHEVHPLRGRSLTPELCRKDVEMFRAGNCNYLRTSHYPPSEEFLQACDELGMLVESESSLCWIQHHASPIWQTWNYLDTQYLPHMVRANYENVLSGRQHPCIILWSLGNESRWSPLWERVNAGVKQLDPSRPTAFHDQCWGDFNNAGSKADVANYHYPDLNGPRECEKEKNRPTLFGEYMHVQCYARRELETDPSVRSDAYANTLKQMVDSVYQYPASLGGAIWSGIDDIFHISENEICGYGPWGPIDGWRRPKPEYIGMKKSYSPVIIANLESAKIEYNKLKLELENRFNFTNLNEILITAQIGKEIVTVKATIAPLSKGSVTIDLPNAKPSDQVLITFADPRGFICQEELIKPKSLPDDNKTKVIVNLRLKEDQNTLTIHSGTNTFAINKTTGFVEAFAKNGEKIFENGGQFMLIPFNNDDGGAPNVAGNNYTQDIKPLDYFPDENFKTESVIAEKQVNGSFMITLKGGISGKLTGNKYFRFNTDGSVTFSYNFETLTNYTNKNLIRQFGLLFSLPETYRELEWERTGLWTVYPDYDINRLKGKTKAHPRLLKYVEAAREIPSGEWKDDANKLGTNDFKSTKDNVISASLTNRKGNRLEIKSSGNQSVRAWIDGNKTRFLIAGLNGPGSCGFFTGPRPQFKKGEQLKGEFTLEVK